SPGRWRRSLGFPSAFTQPSSRSARRASPSSPRPQNRTRQAGRAAFGFQGYFVAPVDSHAASRLLEPPLGDWIPFEHDAISRCDREDVRRHRLEFRIGHFDEIETSVTKELPERRREKPRIDDGEVVVQYADE